jgi:hypothetical protein
MYPDTGPGSAGRWTVGVAQITLQEVRTHWWWRLYVQDLRTCSLGVVGHCKVVWLTLQTAHMEACSSAVGPCLPHQDEGQHVRRPPSHPHLCLQRLQWNTLKDSSICTGLVRTTVATRVTSLPRW